MVITGIQVIRGNLAAQDGPDTAVGVLPGQPIELTYGDKLHVGVSFDYQGPRMDVTLHGAIGTRGWAGFDEIIAAEGTIPLPDSLFSLSPVAVALEIPITADISPGTKYDLYVKINEYPGAGMPQVDDVITISGIPPTFKLLEETIYPYAYIYEGKSEGCTFTFTTDPFHPADWVAGKLAARCEDEVRKGGGKMVRMKVYVDTTPLLWTDWRIEIEYTPPAATPGVAMALGFWPAVVGIILVIIALIALIVVAYNYIIKPLTSTREPGLADVKVAWEKDTLIKTIQDAEEYWERTPTPVETLEGMTEDELREHLDKIAEEEVEKPAAGLGLAIVGAGVLGVGALALAAMAMAKPAAKPEKKR